jgi:hypothetical protein
MKKPISSDEVDDRQILKEIIKSAIRNGGAVAKMESHKSLLRKYRTKIADLKVDIAMLKERLVKYENI